jgi:hypothetical protein
MINEGKEYIFVTPDCSYRESENEKFEQKTIYVPLWRRIKGKENFILFK